MTSRVRNADVPAILNTSLTMLVYVSKHGDPQTRTTIPDPAGAL